MDSRLGLRPSPGRGSVVEEQYQQLRLHPSASSSTTTLSSSGRKKALLTAISKTEGYPELKAAHLDAYKMRDLLIDEYGYKSENINILIDDGVDGHVQPTRENILLAIAELVKDVKDGDNLFFHYCGHSTQVDNPRSNSEEDGKDECLVPMDGEERMIVDNQLHASLVAPLPAGSHLVAILDTCHSGSLLDLKHYRCNRVLVPWIWRGKRNSEEIRSRVVRRGARLLTLSELQTHKEPSSSTGFRARHNRISVMCDPQEPSISRTMSGSARGRAGSRAPSGPLARLRTVSLRKLTMSLPPTDGGNMSPVRSKLSWFFPEEDDHQCDSPVGRFPCNGWCRNVDGNSTTHDQDEDEVKADVISLASCKDSQLAWDDPKGQSMTSLLVGILRENPNRTLKDVLLHISHATYSMALDRHGNTKRFKQQQKEFTTRISHELARLENKNGSTRSLAMPEPPSLLATSPTFPAPTKRSFPSKRPGIARRIKRLKDLLKDAKSKSGLFDMDSFQNPELASPRPLDMNRPWRM